MTVKKSHKYDLSKLMMSLSLGLGVLLLTCIPFIGVGIVHAAVEPIDISFVVRGSSSFYMDSNAFCGATDGPDGMWLPIEIANNHATDTATGLEVEFEPPNNTNSDDTIRYIGNLGPGEVVEVFFFIDYSALRNDPSCTTTTNQDNWYSEAYTVTLRSQDGSGSLTGDAVFASDTFDTFRMISAQAGGVPTSDAIGPGATVGQVITQSVVYDFGNNNGANNLFFQPTGNGSTFRDDCFRLIGSEITQSDVTGITVGDMDQLYFTNLATNNGDQVTIEYQWLVLCSPGTSTQTFAWAEMASGTQFKYAGGADYGSTNFPLPNPSLQIVTDSLLPGSITGEAYDVTLQANGGQPPYTWSLTNGSLPPGLGLDVTTGNINGAITVAGNYNFTAAVTDENDTVVEKTFSLSVESPSIDLFLSSTDITFTPIVPDPGMPVAIEAVIRNPGWVDLSDVVINFYDFGTFIGHITVGTLNAGTSILVSFEATFPNAGFRLITIKVDPDDVVIELNETNNEASQVLQVGSPDTSTAAMVVQASTASTCQGAATSIGGQADYVFSEVHGSQDHPVQGGHVTVTIYDATTSDVLGVFTGDKTGVNGSYNQPVLAPNANGTYSVLVTVTDGTITAETQTSLTVNGICSFIPLNPGGGDPSNGGTGSYPGATADVFMYSEHILFSDENPDPGEEMTIFAFINYVGTEPVLNMPVTVNDLYPVAGVLRSFPIDSALVSFPDGQNSSPVAISIPWTNTAAGAHIIQGVIEPSFSQFTGNDKATRLIFVGDQPLLQINKSSSLMVDADEDGAVSPGDTILHTLTYENQGSNDVTNVIISDDYDETLLQQPVQISTGGSSADGVITWNLGSLAAGDSGSVTYEVALNPETQFPSGTTIIVNYAFLSTDQTPTIGTSHKIEVILNQPPEVSIDGTFTVNEGSSVSLTGNGSDPDGDSLTYVWDLDNDGTFETPGQAISFSTDDGPASYPVSVQVKDQGGLTASDQTTVSILNVAPIATFTNSTGNTNEGESVILTFADLFDPSDSDTTAGFLYAYDCTNDGIFELSDDPATSFNCTYLNNGTFTALGRITDKDGDFTDYTVEVLVNNVAPVVGPITAPVEPVAINLEISASATFTDPGVLDTHTAVWDWGDGSTSAGTVTETDGSGSVTGNHVYSEASVYTVVLTVTDNDRDAGESVYEFIVIYDADGGFVTGGGWVWSEAGWCQLNSLCADAEGRASFGFVSKYKKGANVPTGNTEFNFAAGDFNFHSNVYNWLVVNQGGHNAQFKGNGTINGDVAPTGENYHFMIWAKDLSPDSDDTFRIKIWYEAADGSEIIVYDNGFDQSIGGGNIKIHQK